MQGIQPKPVEQDVHGPTGLDVPVVLGPLVFRMSGAHAISMSVARQSGLEDVLPLQRDSRRAAMTGLTKGGVYPSLSTPPRSSCIANSRACRSSVLVIGQFPNQHAAGLARLASPNLRLPGPRLDRRGIFAQRD